MAKKTKTKSAKKLGPFQLFSRNCWTHDPPLDLRMKPVKSCAREWKERQTLSWSMPWVDATLGTKGSPTLMLAGHIDELGLIIKHVSDKGFLYFMHGGHDRSIISGRRVDILTKKGVIRGVTGKRPFI